MEDNGEDIHIYEEKILKVEPEEDGKPTSEIHPCDICEKVFLKVGTKLLHMRKAHNIRTMQYTPAPGNRKAGRPHTDFLVNCVKKRREQKMT